MKRTQAPPQDGAAESKGSAPLISVHDLAVHFPVRVPWTRHEKAGLFRRFLTRKAATVKAVDGVSFRILPGEAVGLVGESGCGKSTLGRAIVQLVAEARGDISFKGIKIVGGKNPVEGEEKKTLRKQLQMIFQDPQGSLNPRMKVGRAISEPMEIHGLEKDRRSQAVLELLEKVGLQQTDAEKYPHEFSGGQKQRIGIARALALKPDFIVCDEPVSALDVSIQAQIINLMIRLQKTESLTYLFISHDLRVVEHICDRVMVMYLGRIVESQTCGNLYKSPRHPYTKALLASVPSLEGVVGKNSDTDDSQDPGPLTGDIPNPLSPPSGCAFHPRCPVKDKPSACMDTVPELRTFPDGSQAACHLAE